jgi:hypothetical protein
MEEKNGLFYFVKIIQGENPSEKLSTKMNLQWPF